MPHAAPPRTLRRISRFLALALCTLPASLYAANVTATWTGGTANWSSAANWSTNPTIPDNNASDTYSVQIDGGNSAVNSIVNLDSSRTISGLLIDSSDKLNFLFNQQTSPSTKVLTLAGGGSFIINGTIQTQFNGDIAIAADTTLSGAGTITALEGEFYSTSVVTPYRLTIASTLTLDGYYIFGNINKPIALTNYGTIRSNQNNNGTSFFPSATFYNSGNIICSNGSDLYLGGIIDNTGGIIQAESPNSVVHFVGPYSVSNGTINLTNRGKLEVSDGGSFSNTALIIGFLCTANDGLIQGSLSYVANDGLFAPGSITTGPITGSGTTTIPFNRSVTAASLRQSVLELQGNAANQNAKLTIAESAPTHITSPNAPAGSDNFVSVVKFLAIAKSAGAYVAALDLTNNDLIIDYTGKSSPLAEVEAMVKSGFNNGTWTGKGITSSIAALSPNLFHLAVADNAQLGGTAFNTFDGIDTSSHQQIIIKFTWIADINLDGLVNSNDAIAFNTYYTEGQTGAHHMFGDLNYDGIINSNDAILFSTAYNASLPHLPEPASLSLLALGAATLLTRRRR